MIRIDLNSIRPQSRERFQEYVKATGGVVDTVTSEVPVYRNGRKVGTRTVSQTIVRMPIDAAAIQARGGTVNRFTDRKGKNFATITLPAIVGDSGYRGAEVSEIGAGLVNGVNAPWNPRLSAGPFTVSIFDGRIQPQNQKELHEAMVTLGPSLTSNTPPSRRREVRRGGAVNENGGYDPATLPTR